VHPERAGQRKTRLKNAMSFMISGIGGGGGGVVVVVGGGGGGGGGGGYLESKYNKGYPSEGQKKKTRSKLHRGRGGSGKRIETETVEGNQELVAASSGRLSSNLQEKQEGSIEDLWQ